MKWSGGSVTQFGITSYYNGERDCTRHEAMLYTKLDSYRKMVHDKVHKNKDDTAFWKKIM